jgi:hypothetical protein
LQPTDLKEARKKLYETPNFEECERMKSSEFETAGDVEDKFQELEDMYQVRLYFAMMF